jgi:hypothetical protein
MRRASRFICTTRPSGAVGRHEDPHRRRVHQRPEPLPLLFPLVFGVLAVRDIGHHAFVAAHGAGLIVNGAGAPRCPPDAPISAVYLSLESLHNPVTLKLLGELDSAGGVHVKLVLDVGDGGQELLRRFVPVDLGERRVG